MCISQTKDSIPAGDIQVCHGPKPYHQHHSTQEVTQHDHSAPNKTEARSKTEHWQQECYSDKPRTQHQYYGSSKGHSQNLNGTYFCITRTNGESISQTQVQLFKLRGWHRFFPTPERVPKINKVSPKNQMSSEGKAPPWLDKYHLTDSLSLNSFNRKWGWGLYSCFS